MLLRSITLITAFYTGYSHTSPIVLPQKYQRCETFSDYIVHDVGVIFNHLTIDQRLSRLVPVAGVAQIGRSPVIVVKHYCQINNKNIDKMDHAPLIHLLTTRRQRQLSALNKSKCKPDDSYYTAQKFIKAVVHNQQSEGPSTSHTPNYTSLKSSRASTPINQPKQLSQYISQVQRKSNELKQNWQNLWKVVQGLLTYKKSINKALAQHAKLSPLSDQISKLFNELQESRPSKQRMKQLITKFNQSNNKLHQHFQSSANERIRQVIAKFQLKQHSFHEQLQILKHKISQHQYRQQLLQRDVYQTNNKQSHLKKELRTALLEKTTVKNELKGKQKAIVQQNENKQLTIDLLRREVSALRQYCSNYEEKLGQRCT